MSPRLLQAVGFEERDDPQRGETGELFGVLGPLDGVVQVLGEEDEAQAADEADEKGHEEVAPRVGRERAAGDERPVDDLDVARPEAAEPGRDEGLVLLGGQRVQEVPHVLDLDPEAVVQDGVAVGPGHFGPLRLQHVLEGGLFFLGGPEVGLGGIHGLADLALELGFHAVQPGLELDHLGVIGLEDLDLLVVFVLGLGVGGLEALDEGVVDELGQGVDAQALQLPEQWIPS